MTVPAIIHAARRLRALSLACLLAPFAGPAAYPQEIKEVRIETCWVGILEGREKRVTRKLKNPKYNDNIRALANALIAPPLEHPDPANLGITREWLEVQPGLSYLSTPKSLSEALSRLYFHVVVLDDNARIEATLMFDNGSAVTVTSISSHPFMLPWAIEGKAGENFNADISRAIGALLPKNAPNRDRVLGKWLADRLRSNLVRPSPD